MTRSRRTFLGGAAVTVTSALAACRGREVRSGCAALKGETIRWIVPYPPGGSTDIYSRILEIPFEKATGAEIVIANEPGAGARIGAAKLRDARPDGRTLGILGAPGLLSAAVSGGPEYPNPARDFSILGCISRTRAAIATGANSPLRTVDDLLRRQETKPLLCGMTGLASNNVLNMAVTASLLGLRLEFLPGYKGSREELLAAMRGDVDLISSNYEVIQPAVESGELRVILQISDSPISSHAALKDVGWLSGPDGWAVRRAAALGRSSGDAQRDAQSLVDLMAAGIVVAGPKGMPVDLLQCLRTAFDTAAADPVLVSAAATARRSLEIANGERAQSALIAAESHIARFAPIVREAIARTRL